MERRTNEPNDDDSSIWKPLLFIIEKTGPFDITIGFHPKNKGIHITDVIPSSTAYKSGLKVGDILCKLGSKGTHFVKNANETTIQNVMSHHNCPLILEVLRELSDEDI